VVKMYARCAGMPYHQITFVPQPVSRLPAARCREYIEGADPVTGRPVIDEIVESLTRPLTSEQRKTGILERPTPRFIGPDTEDNLSRYFVENKMTDYLPIVLPTAERVAAMLKGTSHKPDEVIGDVRSSYEGWSITVEKAAANAVMAGAKPEYFPVILAMAASGVAGISSSTTSFTTLIVVNGPIRKEIGMNSGCGALSPFNQANSVIGRVSTLLSINGGGGRPEETYWGSQGNPLDYSHATFAENEEGLPSGWLPFHVQKGFKPEESVISFFRGWGIWNWTNTYDYEKHKMIFRMANWVGPNRGFCAMLDPIVANDLVKEGFPTKESLSEYVFQNSKLTLGEFWQYHLLQTAIRDGQNGVEPFATWLKQPKDTLITRYRKPDSISVLVVGGRKNDFWQGGDWHHMGSYLIDEWR
jgi:hypothetical protein